MEPTQDLRLLVTGKIASKEDLQREMEEKMGDNSTSPFLDGEDLSKYLSKDGKGNKRLKIKKKKRKKHG